MTLVKNISGVWQPLSGIVTLERLVATRVVTYHDGRTLEEDCPPYFVSEMLDISKVTRLLAGGVWGSEELHQYGLVIVEPFIIPEGKQIIGDRVFTENNGTVSETYEVADLPVAPPAIPLTPEEKMANAGFTPDELDGLIAASIARQATKSE